MESVEYEGRRLGKVWWIQNEKEVKSLVQRIRESGWVAIDTEADNQFSYPEKLCLIQLAFAGGEALVDPLGGIDLSELWEGLVGVEWIIHSARYDLSLLYERYRVLPRRLFDTMVAARLMGERQYGLDSLLRKYFGIELDKAVRRTNWGRRPLTERMVRYALEDVRYLKRLADYQKAELERLGRLEWLEEICGDFIRPERWEMEQVEEDRWRLRGSSRLRSKGLVVLKALWEWREEKAIQKSRPPALIVGHDLLVQIASVVDQGDQADFDHFLRERVRRGLQAEIRRVVRKALARPKEEWPRPRRKEGGQRMSPDERLRYEQLLAKRRRIAGQLGLEPSFIASKAILIQLARAQSPEEVPLYNWQRRLLLG